VKSTVDRVISLRFAKKRQMQWPKVDAHRLLQTRTKISTAHCAICSSGDPGMAVNDNQVPALARAA
jgi:hypothetical protein